MGRLIVSVQLPDSASLERTKEAMAKVDKITPRRRPASPTPSASRHVVRAAGQRLQLRLVLRHPQAVRRTPDAELQGRRRSWPSLRKRWAEQVKDAAGHRVRLVADPRPQRRRRLQAHGRGPRRPRPAHLAGPDRQADRKMRRFVPGHRKRCRLRKAGVPERHREAERSRNVQRRSSGQASELLDGGAAQYEPLVRTRTAGDGPDQRDHAVSLQHAAALHGHRPGQGRVAGRLASTTSTRRCKSISARSTSTASTSSAGTGRSRCRPKGNSASQIDDINLLQVRNKNGADGAARHAGQRARDQRPDLRAALQPLHRGADHRQPAAGHQLRRR